MVRQLKALHAFDMHLGNAIKAARARRRMTREELSLRTGIALSNLKRREDGVNETTVRELERIAAVLEVTTRELVDMALVDYSGGGTPHDGQQLLLAPVSEAPRTLDTSDRVTYIGHAAPALHDAANADERSTKDD
jgi:transcriptional regulator with XRE-family HTH domain